MTELTQKQRNKIIKLLGEGVGQDKIGKIIGCGRYPVRIISEQLKKQKENDAKEEKEILTLENFREEIIKWKEEGVSAFLIDQRLKQKGAKSSESSVKRFLKKIRKEVYVPVITFPGEEAQVDFGYLGKFDRDGKKVKVWAFCMVLSYSRYAFYTTVTEQTIASFIMCHQKAFEFFNGVPKSVKIDNLKSGVIEADFYEALMQPQYLDFLEHYNCAVVTARVSRGQDKGKVESGIKFVKGNFLKRLEHRNYNQLIAELQKWNKYDCNLRVHGTTRKIPNNEFITTEKHNLLQLPAKRYKLIQKETRTVDNYGHVFFQYNHYSVPYHFAGEQVTVESDGKLLKIYRGEKFIASHKINHEKGQFITQELHKPVYKQIKNIQYYREETLKIGEHALRLLDLMIAEKPFHWKNMIKGVFALKQVYIVRHIDLACEKAIEDGIHRYLHVRKILEKKLYRQEAPPPRYPRQVGGFFHELDIYDQIARKFSTPLNTMP